MVRGESWYMLDAISRASDARGQIMRFASFILALLMMTLAVAPVAAGSKDDDRGRGRGRAVGREQGGGWEAAGVGHPG